MEKAFSSDGFSSLVRNPSSLQIQGSDDVYLQGWDAPAIRARPLLVLWSIACPVKTIGGDEEL